MKMYVEWKLSSKHSSALYGVQSLSSRLRRLTRMEIAQYLLDRRLNVPQSLSRNCEEENKPWRPIGM
jgi:hypothetical protein